jgi:hypothetical protein
LQEYFDHGKNKDIVTLWWSGCIKIIWEFIVIFDYDYIYIYCITCETFVKCTDLTVTYWVLSTGFLYIVCCIMLFLIGLIFLTTCTFVLFFLSILLWLFPHPLIAFCMDLWKRNK